MTIITQIGHRAKFYCMCISIQWYMFIVPNMRKIHLSIMDECSRMHRWTERAQSYHPHIPLLQREKILVLLSKYQWLFFVVKDWKQCFCKYNFTIHYLLESPGNATILAFNSHPCLSCPFEFLVGIQYPLMTSAHVHSHHCLLISILTSGGQVNEIVAIGILIGLNIWSIFFSLFHHNLHLAFHSIHYFWLRCRLP